MNNPRETDSVPARSSHPSGFTTKGMQDAWERIPPQDRCYPASEEPMTEASEVARKARNDEMLARWKKEPGK